MNRLLELLFPEYYFPYKEEDMERLSELRPDRCPKCQSSQRNFFVGTDGITCMQCGFNVKPNL